MITPSLEERKVVALERIADALETRGVNSPARVIRSADAVSLAADPSAFVDAMGRTWVHGERCQINAGGRDYEGAIERLPARPGSNPGDPDVWNPKSFGYACALNGDPSALTCMERFCGRVSKVDAA